MRFAEPPVMELAYAVVLEPESAGGFSVTVPALPEVATQGDDAGDALKNVREAIELALEYRRDRGDEIPPSDADSVRVERVAISLGAT
jgi:predicted RNase H-like HicB family nuclease